MSPKDKVVYYPPESDQNPSIHFDAEVVKIGAKRVSIEYAALDGVHRVAVSPKRLTAAQLSILDCA